MAQKRGNTTRKSTPKSKTKNTAKPAPSTFTVDGVEYRVTPRSKWTIEQDDYALALMMSLGEEIDVTNADDSDEKAGTRLLQSLFRSGKWREFLGIAASPVDCDDCTIDDNIERFRGLRGVGFNELVPAISEALTAFFESGTK